MLPTAKECATVKFPVIFLKLQIQVTAECGQGVVVSAWVDPATYFRIQLKGILTLGYCNRLEDPEDSSWCIRMNINGFGVMPQLSVFKGKLLKTP